MYHQNAFIFVSVVIYIFSNILYGLDILLSIRPALRLFPLIIIETRKFQGISGFLHYIAFKTEHFSGILGIPPGDSVDRLAAVDA